MTRALIAGSGNSAHVLVAMTAGRAGLTVDVFSRTPKKVSQWSTAMQEGTLRATQGETLIAEGNPASVTGNPEIARERGLIVLAVPACVHVDYLGALAPYIEPGATIVGLPGQGGFEYCVRFVLGDKPVAVVNCDSLPWTCRVAELGKHVRIGGIKRRLIGAISDVPERIISEPMKDLATWIDGDTKVIMATSSVAVTLMSVNAYTHPPMMYHAWKDWDGEGLAEKPLFYHGVQPEAAEMMTAMSDEVLAIRDRIVVQRPDLDLSAVIPMLEWDQRSYGPEMEDDSSQYSALKTNRSYNGLTHPMIQRPDGLWEPDFQHRYLREDIPHGLAPIRGIAELVGQATPVTDEVLRWSQDKLGHTYLTDNGLDGPDVARSTCPQRYGLSTLDEIL